MPDILNYNSVELAIIYQKEIGRRHVYTEDKAIYLWTEWTFDVIAHVNPQTISYAYAPAGPPVSGNSISAQSGLMPAVTDLAIRNALNVPRGNLAFVQNGNVVLKVPSIQQGNQLVTDCQNGPIVESFDLKRDIAGKTWVVAIRIVTRIRECTFSAIGRTDKPPSKPLISNRWRKTMDTDEDQISCVITEGECIFDSSWLLALQTFPDQYRIDMLQPIMPTCIRDNINVTQMSDGCTYRYSFRDQERHYSSPCYVRAEVSQTEWFHQKDILSTLTGQGLSAAPAIAGGIANGSPGQVIGAGLSGIFNALIEQTPQYYTTMFVRVWGNRNTPKAILLNNALGIAFERMPNLRNQTFMVTMDRVGKMVELQVTDRTGPEELAIQVTQILTNGLATVFPSVFDFISNGSFAPGHLRVLNNFNVLEDSPGNYYGQKPSLANVQPPFSKNARGTLLANLIAQSLHNPCVVPPAAPVPLAVVDAQNRLYQDKRLYS